MNVLLKDHQARYMHEEEENAQRIVVRRKHVWDDTVRKLKGGLDANKPIKVSFVGDVAVDEGGGHDESFWPCSSEAL